MLPYTSIEANQLGISTQLVGVMMAVVPITTVLATASLPCVASRTGKLKFGMIMIAIGQSLCCFLALNSVRVIDRREFEFYVHPNCSYDNRSLTFCLQKPMKYYTDLCRSNRRRAFEYQSTLSCNVKCACFCGTSDHPEPKLCLVDEKRQVHCDGVFCFFFSTRRSIFICEENIAPPCKLTCYRNRREDDLGFVNDEHTQGSIFNLDYWIGTGRQQNIWKFLVFRFAGVVLSGLAITLTSTAAMLVLGETPENGDLQRLWGSIGWGTVSILTGHMNHWASKTKETINFAPGVYLMTSMCVIDIFIILSLDIPGKDTDRKYLFQGAFNVYTTARTQFYMALSFVMGALSGAIWVFGPLRLRNLGATSPVIAAVLAIQGLGGELVHVHLSDRVIRVIGNWNAINASMLGMFLRLLSYGLDAGHWLVLPMDFLQGLSLGLFTKGSVAFISIYLGEGTNSHLQEVISTIYQGVGA